MSTSQPIYLLTIEGIETAAGTQRWCTEIPQYGGGNYREGLRSITGSGSRWDPVSATTSVGQLRCEIKRGTGGVSLQLLYQRPQDNLNGALSAGDTTITGYKTNTAAGRAVGDRIYIDRETYWITAATGGSASFTVTGARSSSPSQAHSDGAPIWTAPPAWTGRLVTLYEVDRDAVSSASETVRWRGYLAGEPSWGVHWIGLTADERFADPVFGRGATEVLIRGIEDPPDVMQITDLQDGLGSTVTPPFHASGAYVWVPSTEQVLAVPYDATYLHPWAAGTTTVAAPTLDDLPRFPRLGQPRLGWFVAMADRNGRFPTFTRDGSATDNPVDIALNLLTSLDGTNYAASGVSYDASTLLYPDYSLGVDQSLIDWDAWEAARQIGEVVRAPRFFLGPTPLHLRDLLVELLSPLGMAAGTKRDGTWTITHLRDIYPDETTVSIGQATIRDSAGLVQRGLGRPVDSYELEIYRLPTRQPVDRVTVTEASGRDIYPDAAGAVVTLGPAGYDFDALIDASGLAYTYLATRMRRVSERIVYAEVTVGQSVLSSLDVGVAVTVLSVAMVDPATGARLTASDTALSGLVTDVSSVDMLRKEARVTVALMDSTDRYALHAPAARVVSWTPSTVTVAATDFSTSDAEQFAATDVVILVDTNGVARSDTTGTHPTRVLTVAPTTINLDTDVAWSAGYFENSSGTQVAPNAGDYVLFALYDEVTATQQATWAHAATGGPGSGTAESVGAGTEDPYVMGD